MFKHNKIYKCKNTYQYSWSSIFVKNSFFSLNYSKTTSNNDCSPVGVLRDVAHVNRCQSRLLCLQYLWSCQISAHDQSYLFTIVLGTCPVSSVYSHCDIGHSVAITTWTGDASNLYTHLACNVETAVDESVQHLW